MVHVVEWFLGLEHIRIDHDAPLLLKWQSPLPAWMLFALILMVTSWIVLVYLREHTSRRRRLTLAVFRGLGAAVLLVILGQPVLIWQRNRVEPSQVMLLLDNSRSMAETDRYGDAATAAGIAKGAGLPDAASVATHSRFDLVRQSLIGGEGAPVRRILERNNLTLHTFAGALERHATANSTGDWGRITEALESLNPDGSSTDLGGAIYRAIAGAHGRRLAAIVLATDGQATVGGDIKDAIDLARDRQVPIYALQIGSPERRRDLEILAARCDDEVFVNDVVIVEARVRSHGITEPTTVEAQLFDDQSGRVLSTRRLVFGPDAEVVDVSLPTKPHTAGRARYRVEIAPVLGEQTLDNNAALTEVRVLDDRVRVLYVDSYPRYEYRYLKNALLREQTVELSVLLLDADEQFVQEGTDPIRRFPETPEELNRYDVVIFGDVDPRGGWLSPAQMTMLQDFVGNEGGGFALIAGERYAPHRFLGTPLEKLLPVRIDPEFLGRYETQLTEGYRPVLTAEGRRSRLFHSLPTDRDGSSEVDDPFASLPECYWFARTLGPRGGASVLAQHPTATTLAGPAPLAVLGRYGSGKIFFQATDDTWRWRRHTGELFHDAYWVQVARLLRREHSASPQRKFAIRTDRKVYPFGQNVLIQLEVLDAALLAQLGDTVDATIARQGLTAGSTTNGAAPVDSRDAATGSPTAESGDRIAVARATLRRIGADGRVFEGSFLPARPDAYIVQGEELPGASSGSTPDAAFRVEQPDLESRRPEADLATLARIAESTGGAIVPLDQLDEYFATIRDRSVQIPDDVSEPLWDSRLMLILFVAALSGEWILRKWFGLI